MKDAAARCLTAIVLVGGWDESKAGDVACLEAVTGKNYEALERELLHIARLDDSPVLKIGTVWKAKAPLELMHLFAPAFTRDELSRFFQSAQAILTKPDPALELKPEQRWMASVYGKARDESGIVIDSITDSLAKLSVYAENNTDERIASHVDGLVRTLLEDADGNRWLSLSGALHQLAEASPEIFLRAVESSLQRDDAPIRRLFTESSGEAIFGRSWHVDLLWALETLAWSPRYLGRVTEYSHTHNVTLPQNLSDRPMNSLVSLFRPWWPQTTAAPEQRVAALDRLIQARNAVAWELLAATHTEALELSQARTQSRTGVTMTPAPSAREIRRDSANTHRRSARASSLRLMAYLSASRAGRIARQFRRAYLRADVRLVETSADFPTTIASSSAGRFASTSIGITPTTAAASARGRRPIATPSV